MSERREAAGGDIIELENGNGSLDGERRSIGPVVVMGVSGSGKSTIGRAIAALSGTSYIEGDDLHPASSIEKMASGIPLEDDDRWSWLEEVGRILGACEGRHGAVATCSALKRSYRDVLRYTVGPRLRFVWLTGPRGLLERRMGARDGHFMPSGLLDSQLETLEDPVREDARAFSIDSEPQHIAEAARQWLVNGRNDP